jgi:hypothetical protein
MNTKIVYILSSNVRDIYLEQTLVSIYSLRLYNSNAFVTLLVDNLTNESLVGKRDTILSMINDKIVVNIEENFSYMQRSRYLKTRMRNYISGDFLYIDSDTIINSSLEEIDSYECEIGAVKDLHNSFTYRFNRNSLINIGHKLNVALEDEENYYNGGVLYVKDTVNMHIFFETWHNYWVEGAKNHKVYIDMLTLAKTNILFEHIIYELSGEWNCNIFCGINYFCNAKIIHYFASNFIGIKRDFSYYFMDNNVFIRIKEGGINDQIIKKIKNPFKCFNNQIEILAGKDVYLIHSYFIRLIYRIYYKFPNVFFFIDKTIKNINKIKK